MLTAKILKLTQERTLAAVDVEFTDGQTVYTKTFHIDDPASLGFLVKSEIALYQKITDFVTTTPTGNYTPPADPVPVQADVDFKNFTQWISLVPAFAAAKSLGWVTGSEQILQDAKSKVMALATANIPKMFN